jgi:phosphatidylglycerol:prolipoprotein diacylglycerol transferase
MYPVLFEVGGITIYSYGFMIAAGSIAGVAYMVVQGKRDVGITFDQANLLFLLIFLSAYVGGKVFLFFEDPGYYAGHPRLLLTGRGFVFYGSFLFAVPAMIFYFRTQRIPTYAMLDVMAVTTCLVHMFGRIGCSGAEPQFPDRNARRGARRLPYAADRSPRPVPRCAR